MKTKFLRSIFSLCITAGAILVACDPNDGLKSGSDEEEEQTVEAASVAEDASDDALEIAYEVEADLAIDDGRKNSSDCPLVTKDTEHKKIIVDFGDGCIGPHGRERSGKIVIAYSGKIGDSIANRIITFENYFVNNKGVTGTIELRDISINEDGNLQSVKRLTDLTIHFPNGESIVFNGDRTREWLSGAGNSNPGDNVYRITGSVQGISTTGRTFTHEITVPIISDWSCAAQGNFARISGRVEMTKLGGYRDRKRIVDYGDGDCDNIITIITVRRTYSITVD